MERKLTERVAAYIRGRNMIRSGDTVVVALSGGADSVGLLLVLQELQEAMGFTLKAIHINHGLRAASSEEEEWVRGLCADRGIPLDCEQIDVRAYAAAAGLSIETAARQLRYQIFEKTAADRIALAHHRRDQAETVLQRLLRGSGLRGLGGIHPVRERYIRPLLEESPETIRAYNEAKGQSWLEDESNRDIQYHRNHIRHRLLPFLREQYNPAVEETLARTAMALQQDEEYLRGQAERVYEKACRDDGLDCEVLGKVHPALAVRVVQFFLEQNGCLENVAALHLQNVLELAGGASGRKITLPGDLTLVKSYDILTPYKDVVCAEREPIALPRNGTVMLPDEGGYLTISEVSPPTAEQMKQAGPYEEWVAGECWQSPLLRTRRSGDYLIASGGRKSVQDYMVDRKIPAEKRDHIYLVTEGDHILWIPGYRLSDGARIRNNTGTAVHLCWYETDTEPRSG